MMGESRRSVTSVGVVHAAIKSSVGMSLLRRRSQAWHQLQPDYHYYFELSTIGPESSTAWFISKWALITTADLQLSFIVLRVTVKRETVKTCISEFKHEKDVGKSFKKYATAAPIFFWSINWTNCRHYQSCEIISLIVGNIFDCRTTYILWNL